jgi:hypothetical protein
MKKVKLVPADPFEPSYTFPVLFQTEVVEDTLMAQKIAESLQVCQRNKFARTRIHPNSTPTKLSKRQINSHVSNILENGQEVIVNLNKYNKL